MRILVITGDRNVPGKSDYTGAFQPESSAFARLHGVASEDIVRVDLDRTRAGMRAVVLDRIKKADAELVAFFCHGYRSGVQLGFQLAHVPELAAAIAHGKRVAPHVVLYACSTGGGPGANGDGGFADKLRDELCKAGATQCVVDAHERPGHCTRLPFVRRFEGRGSPIGGTGGQWIVAPGSDAWKAWRSRLQSTDLRLRFPMLTTAEIHAELLKPLARAAA